MKLALVHDYLNQAGGAERVVAALHRLFPDAPIYTTIADPAVVRQLMPDALVRTSWMQRLPGLERHYRKYFMIYPYGIESLDLRAYDVVLSSSSAYAKSVITRLGARHICYCHTPMRFAWNFEDYAARENWGPLSRRLLPFLVERLRRWDQRTATRPTTYLANSSAVAARIARHYGARATVVYPPVSVERFRPADRAGSGHLVVSRLVAYKRVDLVVEAFNRLERPLTIIGDGPARRDLERMAGPHIRFLGKLPDHEVAQHYAQCFALVFPGEEDFGIVPLEANAAGRPVIAYQAGGALDTVVDGQTGVFFPAQTPEALGDAVRRADLLPWDPGAIRRHAERFREAVFQDRILENRRVGGGSTEGHAGTFGDLAAGPA